MATAPLKHNKTSRLIDESRYPVSDGKPMAETEKHRKIMSYCIDALDIFYADRPDVQVSGNNFLYYEQGNIKKVVSPDVYVVFGVEKRVRDTYMVWKEHDILPAVVIEITSRKTRRADEQTKRPLYESTLGIPEYFQFDPTGDYLNPHLQGFRLLEGRYVPIAPETEPLPGIVLPGALLPNMPHYRLRSEQLGVDLAMEGEWLRIYNRATGEPLLSAAELAQRATAEAEARVFAERRAEVEAQAREVAEERAEQLTQELARMRAELEALRHPQR